MSDRNAPTPDSERRFADGYDEHRWMQLEDDLRLTPYVRLLWLERAKAETLRLTKLGEPADRGGREDDATSGG